MVAYDPALLTMVWPHTDVNNYTVWAYTDEATALATMREDYFGSSVAEPGDLVIVHGSDGHQLRVMLGLALNDATPSFSFNTIQTW